MSAAHGAAIAWQRRWALRADLPRIVEIYNSTVPSRLVTADLEPISIESRIAWFDEHRADFRPLWVLDAAGNVAAWLSFSMFYGRPAYNKTAELSVYVDAAYRGRGAATCLLTAAIADAPALGIDTLLGFIFGHNTPSLELFAKLGFVTWGRLPRVALLDGIERDVVIVGRRV